MDLDFSVGMAPRVLVVGDVMLDHYVWGACDRVSPEAPVQVVRVSRETQSLGGAGNVVANLAALGAETDFVGIVGRDLARDQLVSALWACHARTEGLVENDARPTTVKKRIIAGAQQIARVDYEDATPIGTELEDEVLAAALARIPAAKVVVLSDYGKGVMTERVTSRIIQAARGVGVPVLVDPKGRDYAKYRGASLITPNRKEAAAAVGRALPTRDAIIDAGRELRDSLALDACLITLSEAGMALFQERRETFLPTEAREVFDVTGAGDTVIASIAFMVAHGRTLLEACRLANAAAGIVVGKVGSATVSLDELRLVINKRTSVGEEKFVDVDTLVTNLTSLRAQGKRIVFTNGCFDILHAGHVQYLSEAAALGDVLVVGLNDDDSVRRLKGPSRPLNEVSDRGCVLSALSAVSYVTAFSEDTPLELIRAVQPDVLVKGGDYMANDVVGADVVRLRGGTVKILSFLEGRSTTRTLQRMAGAGE
jgi:D-beta-D-heptose 7-phosphate kinase/D-beta-D-heptose 1-phosphate adenosyltransferase